MVNDVLSGAEFENLWVYGVHRYYYDDEPNPSSTQYTNDLANVGSTGNFLATEVSVLASTQYFIENGGTIDAFVEGLYALVLLRSGSPSEIAYWVGTITPGGHSRAWVAQSILRSAEGAARRVSGTSGATACEATTLMAEDSIPSGAYCIILDRLADSAGATYWVGQLSGTAQLPALWASLSASAEYYTNAQS
jgi:hypothetical protein